jgi:hypothetical protein
MAKKILQVCRGYFSAIGGAGEHVRNINAPGEKSHE